MVGSVQRGYETPTMLSQHRWFKSGRSGNSLIDAGGREKAGGFCKMIKPEFQSDVIISTRQQETLEIFVFSVTSVNNTALSKYCI